MLTNALTPMQSSCRSLVETNALQIAAASISEPSDASSPLTAVLRRGIDKNAGVPGRFYHLLSGGNLGDSWRSLRIEDVPLLLEDYAALVSKLIDDTGAM